MRVTLSSRHISRLLILFILLLLLVQTRVVAVSAQTTDDAVARAYLFHSPTCPHCRFVIDEVLPDLQATYGERFEIRLFNLLEPDGRQVYERLHSQVSGLPQGIPQLYISNRVLVGSAEIPELLPGIIDACLAADGCDWPFEVRVAGSASAASGEAPAATSHEPVYAAYCYDPGCIECTRASVELEALQQQYPYLQVRALNVRDDATLIEALCEHYGVPSGERLLAPALFIGDQFLSADDMTLPRMRAVLDRNDAALRTPPWQAIDSTMLGAAEARLSQRFNSFSLATVAVAGLLDGVNPCAFTTIIFFISYLALVGRRGKDLLLVGAAFSLAVFATYLLLGLGLSQIVARFPAASQIGQIIYGITAAICLLLAALSLADFVKARQGRPTQIWLQLPAFLKRRIHTTIRSRSRMGGYVGAAFTAGILVSVFELACTGQVYLPTIVFMTGAAETRITAVGLLVIYNFMFIVPLLGVFAVTYVGVGHQQLTSWFSRHVAAVKLLTAALFGVLGVWLALLVFSA